MMFSKKLKIMKNKISIHRNIEKESERPIASPVRPLVSLHQGNYGSL